MKCRHSAFVYARADYLPVSAASYASDTIDEIGPVVEDGRVVMLIDERTMSEGEHTGQHLRAAGGALFIGTPTAGANGDVTRFELPGGIDVMFTGQRVCWPDGTQLQRVGLKPDVLVPPTRAGIAAGRDEILDAAVDYITRRAF